MYADTINIGLNDLISKFRYHKVACFCYSPLVIPTSINTLHERRKNGRKNGTSTMFNTNHFILLASAASFL